MNRTINERKSVSKIFLGCFISYISVLLFGLSVKKQTLLFGALSTTGMFLGFTLALYGAYSLGWEYKRINMEENK